MAIAGFFVYLVPPSLKAIPRDVEEQAMVDGYSRLAAFVRVVLPLAFPGIVAVKVVSSGVPTDCS
jgi:multiple sugar transport system permease protein